MEICHVVNTDGPTSIPGDIATALNKREGVNVELVTWLDGDPYRGREGLPVHDLGTESDTPIWSKMGRFADLASRYDVVHTHHTHSGSMARPIAKLRGKTVVSTENAAHGHLSDIGSVANAATYLFADAIVCVSDAVRDSFDRWEATLANGKVSTIYNGVDLDAIDEHESERWNLSDRLGIPDDSLVLGHAGSLRPVKSQRTLIEATLEIVESREEPLDVVIAGDGPLRAELEEQARALGVENVIHFLGEVERSEVYRLMYAVDGFVMPSRNEAFCVAVAEAMATGTPCILSDIDVFREVYDEAALFHAVDDSLELAERVLELKDDRDQRRALAQRGNDLARTNYTLDSTVDAYLDLYERIS